MSYLSFVRTSIAMSLLAACTTEPSVVELKGNSFFPESVNAAHDGTMYVTSALTGEIAKISRDRSTVTTFVAPETAQPMGKTGVLVDDERGHLWACAIATDFSVASELREYDLASGALLAKYPLNNGVCNDLAMDSAGTLYITDSFVGIERLRAGASAIDTAWWSNDPLLQPKKMGDFANDGIVLDGSNLYVNNLEQGTIVRIPIVANGEAGAAVEIKTSSGSSLGLVTPDGMRLVGAGTIVTTEASANTVSKIVIDPAHDTATREVVSDQLERPSSIAVVGGDLWIAEGQIFRAFGLEPTPVQLPFELVRTAR